MDWLIMLEERMKEIPFTLSAIVHERFEVALEMECKYVGGGKRSSEET